MNILLIRGKPTFMDFIVGIPIGLAHIAPIAENKGHYVEILDMAIEPDPEQALADKLEQREWHLAGFTSMTAEWEGAEIAARLLRRRKPSIKTVFGGQHPTIVTNEVMANDFCDYVVMGEGEDTFGELLDALVRNGDVGHIQGLAYKDGQGRVCRGLPRPTIQDLDAIPLPSYHLLNLEAYAVAESARHATKYRRAIQIFTSRGCPWHCSYCHDLFGKRFRARSPEHVLREMKLLYQTYRIQEFMIEDDIFNFDMDRAKRICDLIVESGMKVALQFGNGVRLERFDEELMRKLAEAGTHYMSIAIESASPRIQRFTSKNLKLHMVHEVVGWARKYGIRTTGFFMIGFPTETVEEINMTIRFASRTDLDEALFSIVIPYAGTELNRQIQRMGLVEHSGPADHLRQVPRIKSDDFDFDTLKKLQRKAYFLFFLSRFRFIRMLPMLFGLRSSLKYLRAIERHFLPRFMQSEPSRIN